MDLMGVAEELYRQAHEAIPELSAEGIFTQIANCGLQEQPYCGCGAGQFSPVSMVADDVYHVFVRADGFETSDLSVQYLKGVIHIKGRKYDEDGQLSLDELFAVPFKPDLPSVTAELTQGILHLTIPLLV